MYRHRSEADPYHTPLALVCDKRLSLGAKSLLLNLLARQDNPTMADFVAEGQRGTPGESREDFVSWLKELAECGYLVPTPKASDYDPVATDVYDTAQN